MPSSEKSSLTLITIDPVFEADAANSASPLNAAFGG
jgi:hypothetical protein